MHIQFLEYFVDPVTKEPLRLEASTGHGDVIESGYLVAGDTKYPIVRGIPRFVNFEADNYARSFAYQWKKWPRVQFESENVGKPMEGYTRRMWERITGITDLNGGGGTPTVVDIGCGPGRFTDVARSKGARVIGVDYSSAVEVANEHFRSDPDVCICQADALNLPLKSGSVDGAFSIGVLHHTPAPEQGVTEANRILAPDGWYAVCVYGKGGHYDFPTVQLWRRFFNLLWPMFKHYPPLAYTYFTVGLFRPIDRLVPVVGKAIRLFFPFVSLPDFKWSLVDTFDSLTPSHQSAHECHEVFSWMKRAGFHEIEPGDWGFTAFHGVKK